MCAIHVIPSNPLLIPPHRPCACVWSSMIASTFICFSHSISTGRSSIRSVSTFRSSFIPLSCSKIRFTVPQFPAKRGLIVYDSTVINEYLEERYPDPPLLPKDPIARARARMLENFGDEAILVGDLPAIWMPWWSKPEDRDTARMEKGREGLRTRAFSYLEKELRGREYLCGTFTLADAPYMALAMVLEVDQMPLDAFPRVAAYLDRLRARPSYKSISPQTSLADSAGRE